MHHDSLKLSAIVFSYVKFGWFGIPFSFETLDIMGKFPYVYQMTVLIQLNFKYFLQSGP